MAVIEPDTRSEWRKRRDEEIAAEAESEGFVAFPDDIPRGTPKPLSEHLNSLRRRPRALVGVVENGMIRLLDPVTLPEHSHVVVVAAGSDADR